MPVGDHVGYVVHGVDDGLVILRYGRIELCLPALERAPQLPAVEYRQTERRGYSDDGRRALEQLVEADALDADERGEIHVGIEVGLRRLDPLRCTLYLGARRGHVRPAAEEISGQRR